MKFSLNGFKSALNNNMKETLLFQRGMVIWLISLFVTLHIIFNTDIYFGYNLGLEN